MSAKKPKAEARKKPAEKKAPAAKPVDVSIPTPSQTGYGVKVEDAKKRLREHTGRQLPLGAADPMLPLHILVDALLEVLPAAQGDALAAALASRL